jgi:hypothetical protein
VEIKGDRLQEALSYADVEPHFAAAQELGRISRTVPVHFIWGSGSPLVCVPCQTRVLRFNAYISSARSSYRMRWATGLRGALLRL